MMTPASPKPNSEIPDGSGMLLPDCAITGETAAAVITIIVRLRPNIAGACSDLPGCATVKAAASHAGTAANTFMKL